MSKKLFKAMCGALAATMLLTACAGGGSSSGGASSGGASSGASSAAASGTASSGEKKTIGFVSVTFSDEYCKRLADAFAAQSTDEYEVKVLNGNGDVAQIISCIETFHSQKVDALIVQPFGNVPDACTWCNEEGVPLVFVNIKPQLSDATKNLDYVYVGSSEEAIGAQLAEAMASGLDQGAKVCALELALGQDNQIYRDKGFCEWLAENRPDIEIIDKQSYKQEATAEAMSITEDWIQRFGVDGIDAIATQGSTITIGVIEALKSHDATDKIKVSGISIPPTMDWILDGTAYSDLYQDPNTEAGLAVDAAIKMLNGEEVELDYPEEKWIDVAMTTVTAENVQEVMASIQ